MLGRAVWRAVQMAATHALALVCLSRAKRATTIPEMESNGTLATKMLRCRRYET